MKIIYITLLLSFLSLKTIGQSYFDTVNSDTKPNVEDTGIKNKIVDLNNGTFDKDKEYYIFQLKRNKTDLDLLLNEEISADSIINKNIIYFEDKLLNTEKDRKRQDIITELVILQTKMKRDKDGFLLQRKNLLENISRYKDTITILIRIDLLKSKISSNKGQTMIPGLELNAPIKGKFHITSKYGYRYHPVKKVNAFHSGIDIRAKSKEVFSALPGKITKVGYNNAMGIYIEILHENNISTTYGHLSEILVLENMHIDCCTPIAYSGNTGSVIAEHLHFVLKQQGKTIDPTMYFNNRT